MDMKLPGLRIEFITQQAVFQAINGADNEDEDDDSSNDGSEEDDEDDGEESSADDEEDEEDDEESEEDRAERRKPKKKKQSQEPPKKLARRVLKKKRASSPSRLGTPPRSGGMNPKSPTVADHTAVWDLIRPRVDYKKVAKSAQCLGNRFIRGGNENLKTIASNQLQTADLVAIPNADFSAITARHNFREDMLLSSYEVYFYTVTEVTHQSMTLSYAGRTEPHDTRAPAEFTVPLQLDLLSRDAFVLPLSLQGRWIIASTIGKPLIQGMFPSKTTSGHGGGSGGGSGRSCSSSSSRGGSSKGSSSSGRSSSSSGSSSTSSSTSTTSSGSSSEGANARSKASPNGGGGKRRTGNTSVSFRYNDEIVMSAGVEGVAELPFLDSPSPSMTAAVNTNFWRPAGSGRAVSGGGTSSGAIHQQPIVCSQTGSEFLYINASRAEMKEASEVSKKLEETVVLRRLLNPLHVDTFLTGKGLDLKSLEAVKKIFDNQVISVRNDRDAGGAISFNGWDQTEFDVRMYSQIGTCKALQSEPLFATFMKLGLFKGTGNRYELDSSSPRLTDLVSSSINFDPELKMSSDNDNSWQKVNLGTAIHHAELVLSLSRHPAVFLHGFAPIVDALNNPTHEVRSDVYTVAALTWHFEMLLAEFFRRIRYQKGPSDVMVFRRILWTVVVSPFIHLTQQVQISYILAQQNRQMQKMEAAQKRGSTQPKGTPQDQTPPAIQSSRASAGSDVTTGNISAAISNAGSGKNPVPLNKKVCKYHFASWLKVAFPGGTQLPECTYKADPSNCPACPHQDFSTWAKGELRQLLVSSKMDFSTSAAWSTMYNGMLSAIEKMA